MSHESNQKSKENQFAVPFSSAFWLVVILVGLYIAGLNFVAAESGDEGEKKETTEMKAGGEKEGTKTEAATEAKKEEGGKAEEKKGKQKEGTEAEPKEEAGH